MGHEEFCNLLRRIGFVRPNTTLFGHAVVAATIMLLVLVWNKLVRAVFPEGLLWQDIIATSAIAAPFVLFAQRVFSAVVHVEARVRRLAEQDALTGVATRRQFVWLAEQELQVTPGILVLLDVDHFKAVNDRFGHPAGDRCLVLVAKHLEKLTRKGDIVGRLGGEEFGIFMPAAVIDDVEDIADRLCGGVMLQAELSRTQVTISAGVTSVHNKTDLESALSRADRALYRAKHAGRARMETCPQITQSAA